MNTIRMRKGLSVYYFSFAALFITILRTRDIAARIIIITNVLVYAPPERSSRVLETRGPNRAEKIRNVLLMLKFMG